MSVTFASAFRPAPSFYQGGGSTDLVPFKYDCAIGGRPYMIDLESNQFQVGWEPRIRHSGGVNNQPSGVVASVARFVAFGCGATVRRFAGRPVRAVLAVCGC